jgi:hypothetical protein
MDSGCKNRCNPPKTDGNSGGMDRGRENKELEIQIILSEPGLNGLI